MNNTEKASAKIGGTYFSNYFFKTLVIIAEGTLKLNPNIKPVKAG